MLYGGTSLTMPLRHGVLGQARCSSHLLNSCPALRALDICRMTDTIA